MGFVRIENYDGRTGYVGDTKLTHSLEKDGITYLFQFDPMEGVYAIISDFPDKNFAIANRITKKETLEELAKEFFKKDEGIAALSIKYSPRT